MFASADISDINNAIQLALAPAFLLTGIAGVLNVMAGRLSRIVDRGRHITEGDRPFGHIAHEAIRLELKYLERRRHLKPGDIRLHICRLACLPCRCVPFCRSIIEFSTAMGYGLFLHRVNTCADCRTGSFSAGSAAGNADCAHTSLTS